MIKKYHSRQEQIIFGSSAHFVIEDHLTTNDLRLAKIYNHLLNHIRIAISLAHNDIFFSDNILEHLISNHALLSQQASVLRNKIIAGNRNAEELECLRQNIIYQLLEEAKSLLEISTKITIAIKHNEFQHIDTLEHDWLNIPFVNYHNITEVEPSIIKEFYL